MLALLIGILKLSRVLNICARQGQRNGIGIFLVVVCSSLSVVRILIGFYRG